MTATLRFTMPITPVPWWRKATRHELKAWLAKTNAQGRAYRQPSLGVIHL